MKNAGTDLQELSNAARMEDHIHESVGMSNVPDTKSFLSQLLAVRMNYCCVLITVADDSPLF
jgi:hypothetical protein